MPEIGNISRLKTWRVRGKTWLNGKGDGTERTATIVTDPGAGVVEAERLGHAALAAQEPAEPAKVTVESVGFEELAYRWDPRRF